MKIGYARVSTDDQNPELQISALKKAGCKAKNIITEKISGKIKDRPGLEKIKNKLREGDTLVIWRLDRLGRSLKNLIEEVKYLEENGVGLQSLNENINTSTPTGKLVFHLFGALAEFERDLIRERTMAGLAAARARGRKGGRKKSLTKPDRKRVADLYASNDLTTSEICEMKGISRPTLYKYVREFQQEEKETSKK